MKYFSLNLCRLISITSLVLLLFCINSIASDKKSSLPHVNQWGRFETTFISSENYYDWVRDVRLQVEFTSPQGKKHTRFAFWDGRTTWRVRFSPDCIGTWRYQTQCSKKYNEGLHGQTGKFECVPYTGANPLYQHGALQLSDNQRYLVHADGTPFFWLADTAWNGPLMANGREWDLYLHDRAEKKFNVIQFVTTQWRAADGDIHGNKAFTGEILIQIRPDFFQRLDYYIDDINASGMIAAPVLLWAVGGSSNPGTFLPEDQRIVLADYLVSRYGAHQVVWFLAGDGKYSGEQAEIWKRIGRTVFGTEHHRLATMHPCGGSWVGREFRDEPWYSFIGYQSGHGDGEKNLRWLLEGPASQQWKEKALPIINLEPNYEDILAYQSKTPFDAHAVRRASYWSLLITPPAGVTYGAHGIWGWHQKEEPPLRHKNSGAGKPWHEAMRLPGSKDMKHLKNFFESIPWWSLKPAQNLLATQPGKNNPKHYITAAQSETGDIAVIYTPSGGEINLNTNSLPHPASAQWYNPRKGEWVPTENLIHPHQTYTAPDDQDWLLLIRESM